MIAVASCFAQILSLIDRAAFERAVRAPRAAQAAKGFSCWEQLVAMLFCQMGAANSLREICGGLATALGKLVHLGLRHAPSRSTLAHANAHRPWRLYETVLYDLLRQCQALAARKRRRFRFKPPLRTLDATIIELCASVFDWARVQRTKGAIKPHLQLDHQGCLPCWALMTDGDTNDVRVAQALTFAPGTIVVVDRGYLDYALYARWTAAGVWFMTRPRTNMIYHVLERRPVPLRTVVLSDEVIQLTSPHAAARCPVPLRHIVIWDAQHHRALTFLTNIQHCRRHLQGPLANRAVLQGAQAASEDHNLRGDYRKCRPGADLNSTDRDVAAETPVAEIHLDMEPVESRRAAAVKLADLSGSLGLAQCAL